MNAKNHTTTLSHPEWNAKGKGFNPISFLQKDGRHFQIVYLGLFLIYGILFMGWAGPIDGIKPLDFIVSQGFLNYLMIFAACITTQVIAVSLTTKNYTSIKSALITALGLCLLCKANSVWILGFAGSVAIASKFLIRYKGKHIFNPANFGIILAILLTGEAWVSPGQWGSHIIMFFVLGAMGAIVLLRVGRLETSLAFLLTFGGLVFIKDVLWQGWPLDHFFHTMTNGSLLLFTFFMITDPVTTPNAKKARILWAILIGASTFFALNFFRVHDAPVYVLFFISPITVVLDRYFKGKRFNWSEKAPFLKK